MELSGKNHQVTEVGLIPHDWSVKKLCEIAELATGNTPPTNDQSNYGDEFFFVSPADLGKGKWIVQTEKKLSRKGFLNSRRFPKNSVLFTCIGSTIGKSGMALQELTSNQQINAVFPNSNYSSDYLYYALSSVSSRIKSLAGEQAVPIINKTQFGETKLTIPPTISEQIAIATALSDTDTLIENLEKLITKKRNIKQGAMQGLFTGDKRLDGFKSSWKEKKLSDIGKTYGGLSGKSKKDFEDGKHPYIPFLNILNNPIIDCNFFDYVNLRNEENQNKAHQGDLFFNGSSETPEEVGMCSVLLNNIQKLYLNSFCFGFRLYNEVEVNSLYLSYFFRSNEGRKLVYSLAQGATRYNLSKNNFLKLVLRVPELKEQMAISKLLSDMDTEIQSLEFKQHKFRIIKQGMMQVLLTGKIRIS